MDIGAMLGGFLGIGTAVGWLMNVIIGTTLAVIYALFFSSRLPGAAALRGAI